MSKSGEGKKNGKNKTCVSWRKVENKTKYQKNKISSKNWGHTYLLKTASWEVWIQATLNLDKFLIFQKAETLATWSSKND